MLAPGRMAPSHLDSPLCPVALEAGRTATRSAPEILGLSDEEFIDLVQQGVLD